MRPTAIMDAFPSHPDLIKDEPTEEETVYQYYTIVSDPEMFLNESNDTDLSENVTFIKEEDSENIMLLSLEQDNQVFLPNIGLNEEASEEDEVTNVKFLTLENGQTFMASTSSSCLNEGDEDLLNSEIINDANFKNESEMEEAAEQVDLEEGSSDSDNFTKIQLEDGTCAYIDKNLWQSLIDNIGEEENKNKKLQLPKKDKKYPCTFEGCDKSYSTSHHLTVHYRSHTGNKPFACIISGCEKSFVTSYSLKAHLRIHTGETPYSCSECPKQFKTSGDLQKHTRTHTGEKPFVCPILGCGRSFTTSNIRKVHIRSHTGERPYACTHPGCGKAFASATNFKNHMRIHSGEKPYACTVPGCGKRFTEYSSLFKHKVVHKPIQPLKCEYCNQVCKHENTLKAHKQAMHKIVMIADGTEIRLSKTDTDDAMEESRYYILTRDKAD